MLSGANNIFSGNFVVDVVILTNSTGNFSVGDTVTFFCNVTGDVTDDIIITWSKDGTSLDDADGYYGNLTGEHLVITDLSEEDAGEYECSATRNKQSSRDSSVIYVEGKSLVL